MNVFDNHYFRINKFFLSCTGLWPYLSKGRKRIMRTVVLITIVLYLVPTVGGLYEVWGKLDLMVECLIPIFTAFGCLVCTFTYIYKDEQLKGLFDCIKSDWEFTSPGEEFGILERHAGDGRILTILYTGCVSITGVVYILTTLAPQILNVLLPLNQTRPKKLPSKVEYFVNWEKYFYYIVVHMLITSAIEVSVLIGCRSTFSILTEHACGLFSNVGYRLKTMMKNINLEKVSLDRHSEDLLYRDVTFCIERHKRAIEFSKTIESCFSPCFFFLMGVTVILMSTTLIQVASHLNDIDDATKFGVFTIGLIIDLFFNSLPAQRLIDHSSSVLDQIDQTQNLVITHGCSLQDCVNDYYQFPDIQVIQMSLSYFTLLSSMKS